MSHYSPSLCAFCSCCRVISRAPGLKLVVETLITSLKPIGNIVLICCAFFIIFGILGVQVQYEPQALSLFLNPLPTLLSISLEHTHAHTIDDTVVHSRVHNKHSQIFSPLFTSMHAVRQAKPWHNTIHRSSMPPPDENMPLHPHDT